MAFVAPLAPSRYAKKPRLFLGFRAVRIGAEKIYLVSYWSRESNRDPTLSGGDGVPLPRYGLHQRSAMDVYRSLLRSAGAGGDCQGAADEHKQGQAQSDRVC